MLIYKKINKLCIDGAAVLWASELWFMIEKLRFRSEEAEKSDGKKT